MRYAIFSDIQGNRQAWTAVLEDMRKQEVQDSVCLGDVVGCGPSPMEVLHGVRAATENVVMGDCDAAVAGLLDGGTLGSGLEGGGALGAGMGPAITWTRNRLDQEALGFLAGRPLAIKLGPLLFAHAESLQAARFACIDRVEEALENFALSDHHVTFVGHGYHAAVFVMNEDGSCEEMPARDGRLDSGKRYIVNVGSVGVPLRPDDVRACYVVYNTTTRELVFRRVPFDVEAYRRDVTAAGLSVGAEDREAKRDGIDVTAGVSKSHRSLDDENPLSSPDPFAALATATAEIPLPEPPPSRRRKWATIVFFSAVAILAVVGLAVAGLVVTLKLRSVVATPQPMEDQARVEVKRPVVPAPSVPPRQKPVGEAELGTEIVSTDPAPADPPPPPMPPEPQPEPEPVPEPPVVAVVPEPQPAPPDPAPQPAPFPPGPPPIPLEPENVAATTPLSQGLMFYAPLDEPENEFTARDLVGGRDLDVTGGLPGVLGRVGMACSLEKQNGSEALTSPAKPLPALKALTIAIWIKRPDPLPADDPEASPEAAADGTVTPPVPDEPPMNIISLKGYCDVRLENNQVVANLDREGEAAQVDFPQDYRWHHVLVENGGGITSIWIDHRAQSNAVGETLGAPPKDGAAVEIGNKGAHIHVDEVAIWNRKFTLEERQILYRNGRLDTPVLSPPKVVAHWGFDDNVLARLFGDTTGRHALGAYKSWTPSPAIAPDPVPLTMTANPQAARVWQVSERPQDAGSFQLRADASFTYQGWMKLGTGSVVILGGIVSETGEEPRGGWRLEARPGDGVTGSLVFAYEIGPVKMEAVGGKLPIYAGLPHHFAVVWNPLAAPTHGTMELHLDNKMIATASLALSEVGPPSNAPFRIVATDHPVVLDELRFTSGALKPAEFLSSGLQPAGSDDDDANPKAPPKEETVMERRARETLERRARQNAERDARRMADEAKRKRERLGEK